jgi:hypothetical protein
LLEGDGQLDGRFWETSYSGSAQGEGMEMVFKAQKED